MNTIVPAFALFSFPILAIAPAMAAPCVLQGGGTTLERAARGLSARQWCELTPSQLNFTQNATDIHDVLGACGDADSVAQYAHNMAHDPSQGTKGIIFWAGTGHGGSYRSLYYDIGTNTWKLGPTTTGLCQSETKCVSVWENDEVVQCGSCNAEHTYDSMTDDNNGTFYRVDYGEPKIQKLTLPSTWNKNWITDACGGAINHTSAMDFWPDFGVSGTLVESCDGGAGCNSLLWLYDMNTGAWTRPFADTWSGCFYNNTINYNHASKDVWVTAGNGATDHYRLWNNGGTATLTKLFAAPPGRLGLSNSKCVDDPTHPDGKFICWDMSEDTIGTTSNGWHEFNLGTDTWTPFSELDPEVNSMPPLQAGQGDVSGSPILVVSVPEYGVSVWLGHKDDEDPINGGMFLYKHTTFTGDTTPPAAPRNLEVQ